LAGFKSFVDPTQIDVPGRLVGVVGPNGCGKSNVIDAVRWVLGESKAAELRGESMQDVIFNGAANRKPAGRASVELVFDNSDGRIGGEWGRFSEISVKRVLTRDGGSSYLINQQIVRRRDVQDMFLGTGLGPRAYAIIGQGMISRIVEARPEELRVFLEEAAGVSKYKERRRETENRLADTRDNLTRVEDILRELDGQLSKLEGQAEVAQKYRELQARHDELQHLLWASRKRDAQAERDKLARDIESRSNALEAHIAEQRAAERGVEETRAAHYAQSDAVHAAQSALMQVNAEIGKLEAQSRLIVDGRANVTRRIESLTATRERRLTERADLETRATDLARAIEDFVAQVAAAGASVTDHDATLPQLDERYHAAREALTAARAQAATAEQAIEAAGAEQRAFDRQLNALAQRREKLQEEKNQLGQPDDAKLVALKSEVTRFEQALAESSARLEQAEAQIAPLQTERQSLFDARARDGEALARLEARQHALHDVQAKVEADEKLDPWLRAQGLDSLPRLFKRLHVEAGWEPAFEAVLRERIEALEVGRLDSLGSLNSGAQGGPPARVAFYTLAGGAAPVTPVAGLNPLAARLRGHDATLAAVIGDWLAGIYVADNVAQALAMRQQLPAGGQFVCKEGHRISRHAVRFYAADDRKSGLLARRQELENLEKEIRAQKLIVEQTANGFVRVEAQLRTALDTQQTERQSSEKLRSQLHAVQIESVRLNELIDRVKHRAGQIDTELHEVAQQESELRAQRGDIDGRFESLDAEVATRQEAVETARLAYEDSDRVLREARARSAQLAAERQRLEFEAANAHSRADDAAHAIKVAAEEALRLGEELTAAQGELAQLDDSAVRTGLDQWLAQRAQAEEKLAEARSRLDQLSQQLKATDEKRLQLEQAVQPKRDRITELQLKEQAARLSAEQYAEQLAEAHADEAALAAKLDAGVKTNNLAAEIAQVGQDITALGAVNLAALEELASARERKGFLDAQSSDLKSAVGTLEDAIRTIDRETRELLQNTFDQVNQQFGQLFPKLFGGGEARLNMTGEEILDAGVQVMAQPPGKRNSTIHLLSGGEKALTATALVFALFKLNPAPFCLLDEVDAPLDDANTERFCALVRSMTDATQFLFITHNKIAMEMGEQLVGVTMQEQGVSRIVAVDIDSAVQLTAEAA
jgi:chromosome segregation protein